MELKDFLGVWSQQDPTLENTPEHDRGQEFAEFIRSQLDNSASAADTIWQAITEGRCE